MGETMRAVLFLTWAVSGSTLLAAEPTLALAGKVKVIGDRAAHNAFTDLIRFRGRWFCAFREGAGHAAGAGTIRVLVSEDGDQWQSAALLERKDVDLRDPKLSVTPDGRLMIVGGAAVPASRRPVRDHYSVVSFSRDGKDWSAPVKVLDSWQWLWRVTWHKGTAYGVAYQWDPKAPANATKYTCSLFRSGNGARYEKVTDFQVPNATEATLAFDGDAMLCLQRRDGRPNTAMLGRSRPPYTDWTWKDLGVYFGGPNLLRAPDGSWWAAGRLIEKGQPHTVVARLDVKAGVLRPLLTLPSGGDTSYPGLAWHGGQLWVSYYSSHEGKTRVYLARVRVSSR
jgi:hypothetical protein